MNHTISNDKLTVVFNTMSGTFSSIKNAAGREYLWQGDKEFWNGQAPICFPICGSLRNDTARTIEGKTISLPRHGFIRKREFEMVEKTDTSIVFRFVPQGEDKDKYPYEYSFESVYSLDGNKINITYRINNLGDVKIPYTMGGHTGFKCPLDEGEEYSDYVVEFDHEEQDSVPT
ncbi:MAG: aldose 1-epimerase family protein, partial [Lachnospiraceae bacterium]|nr:aldose 1-epimerase family protein [Lachnospiraceae bacterium]